MDPITQITLREYGTASAVVLEPDVAAALPSLVRGLSVAPSAAGDHRYDIVAGGTVGAITVGSVRLAIRPRFEMRSLAFMLGFAIHGARWLDDAIPLREDWELNEVVAPGFCRALRMAFSRGILQGYRTEEDALNGIRGGIRFDDQIRRRFGIFPPAEVRFDEFTEDTELNRILKAAVHRLLREPIRDPRWRRELRVYEAALSTVRLVTYETCRLPEFQFTRLNGRYRDAVELAKVILRLLTIEGVHGETQTRGFLVDMPWLFETFVVRALRELAPWPSAMDLVQGGSGKGLTLDELARIRLRPDLSLWRGSACVFVGDVKYKMTAPEAAPNFDLYQLLAYTTALDLPEGMLVYAAGSAPAADHLVRVSGKRLRVRVLDLSGEPEAVLGRLAAIGREMAQMASAADRGAVSLQSVRLRDAT